MLLSPLPKAVDRLAREPLQLTKGMSEKQLTIHEQNKINKEEKMPHDAIIRKVAQEGIQASAWRGL